VPEGEEKVVQKSKDNTVKYLLAAIGVLLFVLVMLFMVKQISQSTMRNQLQEGVKADVQKDQPMSGEATATGPAGLPINITGKNDLTVSTVDKKMCVMRFAVVPTRDDIAPVIADNVHRIMNRVLQLLISKNSENLVNEFSSGQLNVEITKSLNELLRSDFEALGGIMDKMPWGNKTPREIKRIDIIKFMVVE